MPLRCLMVRMAVLPTFHLTCVVSQSAVVRHPWTVQQHFPQEATPDLVAMHGEILGVYYS